MAKRPTKKPRAITGPISDDPVTQHVEAVKKLLSNWAQVAVEDRYERLDCAVVHLQAAFRSLPHP